MTLLKFKDIEKMPDADLQQKMKDLKFELTKSGVTANKAKAKTKEIKRAVARILTFMNKPKRSEVAAKR
ncbi:MAG: 50S ribosomal protein L29 [Nanoarchaeota archaeon]